MASALPLEKKSIKNSEYVLDIRVANTWHPTRRSLALHTSYLALLICPVLDHPCVFLSQSHRSTLSI